MFLIAGITGKVGGAAARALLEQGKQVRALVRDKAKAAEWSGKGVEIVEGDWNDAGSVAAALEGVEGAYLMMPPIIHPSPDFSEAQAVVASYVEALREAAPPKLVLLSSMGSEQPDKLGLITSTQIMERELGDLPFPTAFIRAGSFYENYAPSLPVVASTGTLYSFNPADLALPMIATEDIGREAAKLLQQDWTGKKLVELGSILTPNDVAAGMTEALGRPVTVQAVPRERWTATLEQFGFPAGSTGPYEEMMDGVNSGWIHFGNPGTERVEGTITPAQIFARLAKALPAH